MAPLRLRLMGSSQFLARFVLWIHCSFDLGGGALCALHST